MRIAAVQEEVVFTDVEANLAHTEELVRQAAADHAELVLLPEFFPSAIGFSEDMLSVALQGANVHKTLIAWSERFQIIIGGSYIVLQNGDAFNQFELVFPDGKIYRHRKDIPTQFEGCYYTNGDTVNILDTPIGKIGVALCWEMLRYDTLRRMTGKVDFVLTGSCWWDLPENAPKDRETLRKYNQELAISTPVTFAKLIGVPVIHAGHCGKVTAGRFPDADFLQTRQLVGAAQIINADGTVLTRRSFDRGEGIVTCDLDRKRTGAPEIRQYPKRYWIPDLPESYLTAWNTMNPKAKEYYETVAKPWYETEEKKQ